MKFTTIVLIVCILTSFSLVSSKFLGPAGNLNLLQKKLKSSQSPVGNKVEIENVSFEIPNDWEFKIQGEKLYSLIPKNSLPTDGFFLLSKVSLNDKELKRPVTDLLNSTMALFAEGAEITPVEGPKEVNDGEYKAGIYIIKTNVSGKSLETYLGEIFVGKDAYVFVGLYDPKLADKFRSTMKMVYKSFKVGSSPTVTGATLSSVNTTLPLSTNSTTPSSPITNTTLTNETSSAGTTNNDVSKLIGCWELYNRNADRLGSVVATNKLSFLRGNKYSRYSAVSASVSGFSTFDEKKENGRYEILHNQINFIPDQGTPYEMDWSWNRGILKLGSQQYIPCS
jgi:hypothetical protein